MNLLARATVECVRFARSSLKSCLAANVKQFSHDLIALTLARLTKLED